jgi:glycosyltransferase involved in cell wall biosynthesis
MRVRFVTSTPWNVAHGSGTFVGIATLAATLQDLGATVEVVRPKFSFPVYTAQRLIFNRMLLPASSRGWDVTVGFDMDGYTLAGTGHGLHVAAIKGVIADEMRFESGLTKVTMGIQAARERRHVRRADRVITTSEYSKRRIEELYGGPNVPRVIPELIDLASWNRLLQAYPARAPTNKFIVLSVGRLYPRKRMHVLLNAAERLLRRIPEIEIRIVGDGPEAKRLKAHCSKLRLDNHVTWLGSVSRETLVKEYNQAQVFCLPSVQEGFGLVFLEAMASGKPIVAVRAGATPEVVKRGLLVEPDNDQALAEAIEQLYCQPNLREKLAAEGRDFVKVFDAPSVGLSFLGAIAASADSGPR